MRNGILTELATLNRTITNIKTREVLFAREVTKTVPIELINQTAVVTSIAVRPSFARIAAANVWAVTLSDAAKGEFIWQEENLPLTSE